MINPLCVLKQRNMVETVKVIYEVTMANNADDERRVYFGTSDTDLRSDITIIRGNFNHERHSICT